MPDASFVSAGPAADIPNGEAATVDLGGGIEVAVFNANGAFYALENSCPHQGARLSDGWVRGTTITCPWHAWCFNLPDGTMTLGAYAHVDPYDVRIENGEVFVSRAPRKRPA